MRHRRFFAREQRVDVGFEPFEKGRVAEERVFDDLCETCAQFPHRQCGEGIEIGEHRGRLMESADQILTARMIHAGLAADRRIHLRQQGRRNLDEIDAALIARGGKPRDVAHDATAQRQHTGIATEAVGHQHIENARDVGQRLERFAVGQDALDDSPVRKPSLDGVGVERRYGRITYQDHIARAYPLAEDRGVVEQTAADQDRVGACAECNIQDFHATWSIDAVVPDSPRSARSAAIGERHRQRSLVLARDVFCNRLNLAAVGADDQIRCFPITGGPGPRAAPRVLPPDPRSRANGRARPWRTRSACCATLVSR